VISTARARRGVTTATAAAEKHPGISASTWQRIEKGVCLATPESYRAIDCLLELNTGTTERAAARDDITLEEYAEMVGVTLSLLIIRLQIVDATRYRLAALDDLRRVSELHHHLINRDPDRDDDASAKAGREAQTALQILMGALQDEIQRLSNLMTGEE
jgi:hypothetical protein